MKAMIKNTAIAVLLFLTTAVSPVPGLSDAAAPALSGTASVIKEDLKTLRLELVQTLARALEAKDLYTRGHSERIRLMAGLTARELKLPEETILDVEYAALLHDIGKIAIDNSILLKPGRLTDEEYGQMKKHPAIGHEIIAPVSFLKNAALMVLHHQEWFNGRGYPKGLKGEAIPAGARIISVLDAWDAMTSDRPYRKALARETALGELKKGSGSQFDPKVVEAFLRIEQQEWKEETARQ